MKTQNINHNKLWIRNYSISIILHLLLVIALIYFYQWQSDNAKINAVFFTLDTKEFASQVSTLEKTITEENINENKEFPLAQKTDEIKESKTISFSDIIADTTNLDQVYSEPTLNISIRYPKGWTFVDQNKKKKLDGVTFWAADGLIYPPPYIHLEVVSKDMFIEKRYLYKMDLEKYQAYYNDPEEMQGYVSQIIYIKTSEDEDFRLKLMVKGVSEFESFQPKFWAILKSLNFGSSLF